MTESVSGQLWSTQVPDRLMLMGAAGSLPSPANGRRFEIRGDET